MRDAWTDGRLDDLNDRVGEHARRTDEGFVRVDARFAQVDARFAQVDARFAQVDARFAHLEAKIDARFESLQRLILQVGASTITTTLVAVLGAAALR